MGVWKKPIYAFNLLSTTDKTFHFYFCTEAELEAKVRRIAQVEVLKHQMQIKKELEDRDQAMRNVVNTSVKKSQLDIESLRDNMNYQASMT